MTRRATPEAADLDGLATEAWNAAGADLDLRSTAELVALMNEEDARVPAAVGAAQDAVAAAIDAVVARLAGGRLVYVGAGTSGRLAVVDASSVRRPSASHPASSSRSSRAARRQRRDEQERGG